MSPTAIVLIQLGVVLAAAAVIAIVLFLAVMRRLERLDHRPTTPCMKRGTRPRWWLLVPVVLVVAGGLWWAGHPELAR